MKPVDVVFFLNHKHGEVAYLSYGEKEIEIFTAKSKWIIHLNDYARFGKFTLSHLNYEGDREYYHRQTTGTSVDYLVYMAIRHDVGMAYSWEDWKEFQNSWDMYIYGQKLQESCSTWAFLAGEDWYLKI
jgi:hypothetical protein